MKISKIVKKTKEYERLQGLIDEIQVALDIIEKLKHPKPEQIFMGLSATISWVTCGGGSGGMSQTEYLSLNLSSGITDLIKADLEKLLKAKMVELMKQQHNLEV